MSRAIIWFRHDQRLIDNEAVHTACREHAEVLPVLVVDPKQHGRSPLGIDRSGKFRRKFITEGYLDLDQRLRAKGSALHVEMGEPSQVLSIIAARWGAEVVYATRHHAWEERQHEERVRAALPLRTFDTHTLLHPDDLPFSLAELPHVFTEFRTKVEKHWVVREPFLAPEVIRSPEAWSVSARLLHALAYTSSAVDRRAVLDFRGGRPAALERLAHYCAFPARLGRYKATRNALVGADTSGKFSPWLASGAISPREVYRAVKEHEHSFGASEHTYWMIFELLWRDFFQFTAAKHGRALFQRRGMAQKNPMGSWDRERFGSWCHGRTGQPFIDANMREIAATGWMSNRGRQNVASYLVHDLGVDWRMGAWWFEHLLVDYDPCSNWGNWQYVAGVGNDPREGRRFDPVRQASMYDPEGTYVNVWT